VHSTTKSSDNLAAEQTIEQINHDILESVRKRDIEAIAATYASDAALLVPGRPALVGIAAISAGWETMLALPGFTLEAERVAISISSSGDLAVDRGWYRLSFQTPDGATRDEGKYLAAWRKDTAGWKMIADIFNTDLT
jgi:ketosteroid isomerase-like protein